MGFFTTIGSALGLINSNPTASELAKDISSGVDMLVYTKEEKAIDSMEKVKMKGELTVKATDAWLRMIELTKDAEKYRSVTRRILAVGLIFNLLAMIWMCVWAEVAAFFGLWGVKTVKMVAPVGTSILEQIELTSITWAILKIAGAFQLGWVFSTIIVFYYGPQLIQFFKKPAQIGGSK